MIWVFETAFLDGIGGKGGGTFPLDVDVGIGGKGGGLVGTIDTDWLNGLADSKGSSSNENTGFFSFSASNQKLNHFYEFT